MNCHFYVFYLNKIQMKTSADRWWQVLRGGKEGGALGAKSMPSARARCGSSASQRYAKPSQ
jgi:hypothetical protein